MKLIQLNILLSCVLLFAAQSYADKNIIITSVEHVATNTQFSFNDCEQSNCVEVPNTAMVFDDIQIYQKRLVSNTCKEIEKKNSSQRLRYAQTRAHDFCKQKNFLRALYFTTTNKVFDKKIVVLRRKGILETKNTFNKYVTIDNEVKKPRFFESLVGTLVNGSARESYSEHKFFNEIVCGN